MDEIDSTQYDCIVLIAAHSNAGSIIKTLDVATQTTISSSPGICNAGSEHHFDELLKPYQQSTLLINEKELLERYQPIKRKMNLDPSQAYVAKCFLEDTGFIGNKLSNQYREKEYHFTDKGTLFGHIKIIPKNNNIIDITSLILSAKRESDSFADSSVTKTDVFDFLEGAGFRQILYIDMSCNLTSDPDICEQIRTDKIVGGKKQKTKRFKKQKRVTKRVRI